MSETPVDKDAIKAAVKEVTETYWDQLKEELAEKMVDKKTEYQCAYAFHSDLIKSRFTVAGFYLAATAVVLGKLVELAATSQPRDVISLCIVMICLAVVCICIEERTKDLYWTIGRRLAFLERTLGKCTEDKMKAALEECPEGGTQEGREERAAICNEYQVPLFYFEYRKDKKPLVSHRWAFRLLYWGSFIGWILYALAWSVSWKYGPQCADYALGVAVVVLAICVGFCVGRHWKQRDE